MKKKLILAGLCMTAAATLCACTKNGSTALSVNETYALGAVSTVRLLGENLSANAVKTLAANTKSLSSAPLSGGGAEDTAVLQTAKFNEYFTALDSFLGEDIVTTTVESNPDAAYPYDTKMTINGRDFDGNAVSYIMYYTETLRREKTDGGEKESEYSLIGALVLDGKDYILEGERSTEEEKGESETELKIRAYADENDRTSYIEMEHGYSVEKGETETEYLYSVYSGGTLVEQTSVEFERESKNGTEETEYELEFIKGEAKGKYKLTREARDGSVEIKVKYTLGNETTTFKIREVVDANGEKQYEYTYNRGTVLTI